MAELTWENGHLGLHGLGHSRIEKPSPKYTSSSATAAWVKPRPSGTLEAVVDQATRAPLLPPNPSPELAARLAGPRIHCSSPAVMDALVPSAAALGDDPGDPGGFVGKRERVGDGGWACASQGSAAAPGAGRAGESTLVTLDTYGGDDVWFTNTTATNRASPETENTSFGGGGGGRWRLLASDDRDSVCLSRRSQAAPTSPFFFFH